MSVLRDQEYADTVRAERRKPGRKQGRIEFPEPVPPMIQVNRDDDWYATFARIAEATGPCHGLPRDVLLRHLEGATDVAVWFRRRGR